MPYQVPVFISHSWTYSEHYDTLAEWIFEESWNVDGEPLQFLDKSVPKDNPIHYARNERELRAAIFERIASSRVAVIPTGMYANYSNWIQKEIDGAGAYAVPILAVDPWGAERKSSAVKSAAKMTVGWNSKSVVSGIWQLC